MTDRPRTRSEAFAHRLGQIVSDLHDLEQVHAVLVLPESSPREARYPAWQIDATGQPCPARTLGDSGWTIYRLLMQSHPELAEQTALATLRDGRGPLVRAYFILKSGYFLGKTPESPSAHRNCVAWLCFAPLSIARHHWRRHALFSISG